MTEVVFVLEKKLGGVAYFNRNLINYTSKRNLYRIKVIWIDLAEGDYPRFTDFVDADEIVDFVYSVTENRYSVLKRLHKLFGSYPGPLVCNDGLELEAISVYGTAKTVFQVIHDFYNIKLAVKYEGIADAFVTHTALFADVLVSSDPRNVKAYHLPHGVVVSQLEDRNSNQGSIRIVFAGRLVEPKGVGDLFKINQELRKRDVKAEWTIIGRGPLKEFLLTQWRNESNVTFSSPDSSEEVLRTMSGNDLFILPTSFEGSPVTILEALSLGLVPIVTDLPGGIREIVSEQVGCRIPLGDLNGFASAIADLHEDRVKVSRMSKAARGLAVQKLDIRVTSDRYFDLFSRYAMIGHKTGLKSAGKVGFRLDQEWIPNWVVKFLRSVRHAMPMKGRSSCP